MTTLLPTPEPADPVEGQPGHFAHSNWVKQAVKDLDAGTVHKHGDTMTGSLTVAPPSGGAFVMSKGAAGQSGYFYADGGAGAYSGLQFRSNGSLRWNFVKHNGAESGGNVGSDLWLFRYADDGSQLPTMALQISRATGLITVAGDPTALLGVATKQYADGKVAKTGDQIMTGNLTIQNRLVVQAGSTTNGAAIIHLSPDAGKDSSFVFQKSGDGYCAQIIYLDSTDDLILRVWRNNNTEFTNSLIISRATGKVRTAAGDPTTADGIATKNYVDNVGKWQAYTPTLTGITLGTGGSVAGRYTRIGDTIHYEVRFSFGTGGSVNEATGKSVSLPVAIRSGSKGLHSAHVGNSAAYFMLNAFIVGGTTAISLNGISADGSASNITNTHPVPIPGTSTSFYVTGTYEAA